MKSKDIMQMANDIKNIDKNHRCVSGMKFELNKAVKPEDKFTSPLVDRNPKDFILFYAKDFALKTVAKDNTGKGTYNNDIVFPTLAFPSDHAITKATVALL